MTRSIQEVSINDTINGDNTMTDSYSIPRTLRDEMRKAREDHKQKEEEIWGNRDCPHCERVLDTGSVGGGEVTFGCYPPLDNRESYDCPYYEEHGYAYKVTRKTGKSSMARARYEALLDLSHRIAVEERQEAST